MQGRGITNYDTSKPSHELTTATTEFDDELIRRGIVTTEQVMLAKGASPEEAVRLANEKKKKPIQQQQEQQQELVETVNEKEEQEQDSDDDDDDDDEFFARYRQERLEQLQHESSTIPNISRDEWTIHVNKASFSKWILVILWDDTSMRTQETLQDLQTLLRQYSEYFGIVRIPYQEANPHWPKQRVPAIFAYRDGIKQHEYVTTIHGKFPTPAQLLNLLSDWDVLLD